MHAQVQAARTDRGLGLVPLVDGLPVDVHGRRLDRRRRKDRGMEATGGERQREHRSGINESTRGQRSPVLQIPGGSEPIESARHLGDTLCALLPDGCVMRMRGYGTSIAVSLVCLYSRLLVKDLIKSAAQRAAYGTPYVRRSLLRHATHDRSSGPWLRPQPAAPRVWLPSPNPIMKHSITPESAARDALASRALRALSRRREPLAADCSAARS